MDRPNNTGLPVNDVDNDTRLGDGLLGDCINGDNAGAGALAKPNPRLALAGAPPSGAGPHTGKDTWGAEWDAERFCGSKVECEGNVCTPSAMFHECGLPVRCCAGMGDIARADATDTFTDDAHDRAAAVKELRELCCTDHADGTISVLGNCAGGIAREPRGMRPGDCARARAIGGTCTSEHDTPNRSPMHRRVLNSGLWWHNCEDCTSEQVAPSFSPMLMWVVLMSAFWRHDIGGDCTSECNRKPEPDIPTRSPMHMRALGSGLRLSCSGSTPEHDAPGRSPMHIRGLTGDFGGTARE